MNSKVLIIAVLVLLLGAGGYFYFVKGKNVPGTGNAVTSGAKSLKELIAAGIPQKCTFSSNDDSGKNEGISYVAGGKVRADITNTISGKTTTQHMISDNKTSYIWQEGDKNGFKMTVTESETTATSAPVGTGREAVSSGSDLNQKADYKCSAWIPDDSLFTPPSNVSFTDYSKLLAPTPSTSGGTSSQCSYCNQLSGEEKTSCLSALNCK